MKTLRAVRVNDVLAWIVAGLLILCAGRAFGQEPLEIVGGEPRQIKVEKSVITYVEATLVSKLPFTLKAPPGGFEYEWNVPKTVKAVSKRSVLEITEAAKGETTISVTWIMLSVENGAIKTTEKSAARTFYVGDVTPPKPPVPPDPPAPDTPLVKALKEAWAKESLADKGKLPLYVAANANAAAMANDSTVKTVKQVRDKFVADSVAPALPNLRAVVSAELDAKLPRTVNAVLDEDNRRVISSTFDAIAAGLRGLQ